MKITFLSTAYPFRGGIASFNEMLATELQNGGHKVDIWTFTVQYPQFLFPGKTQYSDAQPPKGLKIKRVLNSINPFNWIVTGVKLMVAKPDILFLRYWSPYLAPALATAAYIARLNGKTKVVALADNIVAHEKHFYDDFLTSYFVGCAHRFVVMSREVEADLRKFTPKKPISFSPHPIYSNYGDAIPRSEAISRLGLDETKRYSLFFGLIRPYKGLGILLDSWAKFRGENDRLIVAGEYYTDKNQYLRQIEELGIGDSVMIVDKFIADSEVKNYFCASSVIIQPYKSATQSGITQIAYNFNTPMIVTAVGGLAEIVPDGVVGYVVPPNVEDVTDAMNRIFAPQVLEQMEGNFEKEKLRFSWKVMGEVVVND